MIWFARFFIDQVFEQLFSRGLILAARMHGREISRECCDVLIILRGVVLERCAAQLAPCPREIERMF